MPSTCAHCKHPERSTDYHARYKPYDKSLPKRCRGCSYCTQEFGPLPPTDD